ncbi:hypothetical protein N7474_005311 [Penicillium riverlandense]|uniref:uncharacterized protein n=1 Tax=Penicillium riverlandense TaxID=1903569 RepID=UPI00254780F6|nr:uncharacterized protein N7474_005311 [Penicillium riverlandense]KAJ5819720.1 hypothetical protein N7474_005311 [Penicillium riverlandense]
MSTDPPAAAVPAQEGVGMTIDPGTKEPARRASTTTSRRSRRKKDDDPDSAKPPPKKEKEKDKDTKEKPARAPRRPREKSTTTAASRKKPKLEGDDTSAAAPAAPADPPTVPTAPQPAPSPYSQTSRPPSATPVATYPPLNQSLPPPRPQSQPPPPNPQRTSGQNFDPIRSAFGNTSPAPVYSPPHAVSPRNAYRASASPAISSIIDPPSQNAQPLYPQLPRSSSGHVSAVSSPAQHPVAHTPTHPSLAPSPLPASSPSYGAAHTPQQPPPSNHFSPYAPSEQRPLQSQPPQLQLSPPVVPPPQPQAQAQTQTQTQTQPQPQPQPPANATPSRPQQPSDAMEVDSKEGIAAVNKPSAPSPKPAKAAKEAPPLPQGSGLITNALFGGDDSANSSDSRTTPNIIVHIPLQKGNQIVNFARLAEERYGFAALHPRLAAHKQRLARIAAAGAALEKNEKGAKGISAGESADEDLSLDRDSDLDGDVSMGGTGAGTNGAPSEADEGTKKRRRKKVEEYDRDDPFVDDSEMAWQETAAASKDGFFVYSGPLVQEGEKVQVERADGTIKRGRGRGRGAGRARTLTSHQHVPIAAAVPISQDTGLPLRGPGSRGGTSRRPRTTKKADQDKDKDKDKQSGDRNGSTASASHEGRGGRAGGSAGGSGRGGSTASGRGGKSTNSSAPAPSSMMTMMDLAPAPGPTPSSNSTVPPAPAPALAAPPAHPGPSPLAGPELIMK